MIQIESKHNAVLRHLARLGKEKKYRKNTDEMLCEGEKMLEEALRSGAAVQTVLIKENAPKNELYQQAEQLGAALYMAPEHLFADASEVETPQNVIFSCKRPVWQTDLIQTASRILLLDGIQDPGNMGTILRTADAFGMDAVILCEGTVDMFSAKVIRATMGAIFRLPCLHLSLEDAHQKIKAAGLSIYTTALAQDSEVIGNASMEKSAVIIGSEGKGVSEKALSLADKKIIIPMRGNAESLNAAVAASIIMYEMSK